jgi:hypothetical protein
MLAGIYGTNFSNWGRGRRDNIYAKENDAKENAIHIQPLKSKSLSSAASRGSGTFQGSPTGVTGTFQGSPTGVRKKADLQGIADIPR